MNAINVNPSTALPTVWTPPVVPKVNFRQWISNLQVRSQEAWVNFKAKFVGESPTIEFLKQSHINGDDDIDKLVSLACTTNPFSYQGHLIKRHMQYDKEFAAKMFDKMFESSNMNYEKLSGYFEESKLRTMLQNEDKFNDIMMDFSTKCLPKVRSLSVTIPSKIAKTLQVVLRFFPNFMDTVLKAFSLIDVGKGPQTIWDFAAMLEIYYKMFMIPFAIFLIVGFFIAIPLVAMGITALAVIALVVLISLYLKFRPCPNQLSFCKNLTQEVKDGKTDPVIGRERLINEVIADLGGPNDHGSVILVGESGVGKSSLVRAVAAKYPHKKIFAIDSTEVTGGYSIQNALKMILIEIKGHEKEVVLFMDEFGDAATNSKANITGLIKPLVEGGGIQMITIATADEYENKILQVEGMARRFRKIEVEATNESETIRILDNLMKTKNYRFQEGLAQSIWEQTKNQSQPSTAIDTLNKAIEKVREWNPDMELKLKKGELERAREAYQEALDSDHDNIKELGDDVRKIHQEYNDLKGDKDVILALKIKELIKKQRLLQAERNRLSRLRGTDKKDLIFLQWILLPWVEQKIKDMISIIPEKIPMEVSLDSGKMKEEMDD